MSDVRHSLNNADLEAFAAEAKVGILATANHEGLPHLTLITSLRAKTATQLTFGQFCVGQSKGYLQHNPRCAFVVMTLDKRLWWGQARWTHKRNDGDDYILYNKQSFFRYNAYTGFDSIHYLDLKAVSGPTSLKVPAWVAGTLRARAHAALRGKRAAGVVLKPWAVDLMKKLEVLKFAAYVDDDGGARVVPLVPAYPVASSQVVVNGGAELAALAEGQPVALFALSLKMESVLMRGRLKKPGRSSLATLEIDWVYNSMLPVSGQIYPPPALEPVRDFGVVGDYTKAHLS